MENIHSPGGLLSIDQQSSSSRAGLEGSSSPITDAVFTLLEKDVLSSVAWQASKSPADCETYVENCLNRVAREFAEISLGISMENYVLTAASKVTHLKYDEEGHELSYDTLGEDEADLKSEEGHEFSYETLDKDESEKAMKTWSDMAAPHIERWKTDESFAGARQEVKDHAERTWGGVIHQAGFKIPSEVLGWQEAKGGAKTFAEEDNPFDSAFATVLSGTGSPDVPEMFAIKSEADNSSINHFAAIHDRSRAPSVSVSMVEFLENSNHVSRIGEALQPAKRKAGEQENLDTPQHRNKRQALTVPAKAAPVDTGSPVSQQSALDPRAEKLIDAVIGGTLSNLESKPFKRAGTWGVNLFKENLNALKSKEGVEIDVNKAVERYKAAASQPTRKSSRLANKP